MEPDTGSISEPTGEQSVAIDDRPMCYWETQRSGKKMLIIRASSIGACTRALVAASLGYEPQRYSRAAEILDTAAVEGNLHEGSVLDRLKDEGYELRDLAQQSYTELEIIPGVLIRGHIDGWAVGGPDLDSEAVVEVKSMSKDRFDKWMNYGFGEFQKYAWQLSAYMWYYNIHQQKVKALYAVKDRNSGRMNLSIIDEPPISHKKIRLKAIEVLRYALSKELPGCDPDLSSGERYFCPFVMLHDEDGDIEENVLSDDETISMVISGMAEKHYELGQEIKRLRKLEDERRAISATLTPLLQAKKTIAGDYKVVKIQSSRPVLDVVALAADLGLDVDELNARYKTNSTFEYLRIDKIADKP